MSRPLDDDAARQAARERPRRGRERDDGDEGAHGGPLADHAVHRISFGREAPAAVADVSFGARRTARARGIAGTSRRGPSGALADPTHAVLDQRTPPDRPPASAPAGVASATMATR